MIRRSREYWTQMVPEPRPQGVFFLYDTLKLKPCPFCGQAGQMLPQRCKNPVKRDQQLEYFMVRCRMSCGCKVESITTSDARTAQLMWNNRVVNGERQAGFMWKEDDFQERFQSCDQQEDDEQETK